MDSKDSTFQGLMFSTDNTSKVEACEFLGNTSAEGEPSKNVSVAVLFDMAIWINETKYDNL